MILKTGSGVEDANICTKVIVNNKGIFPYTFTQCFSSSKNLLLFMLAWQVVQT